jgi:hypothetical protein
MINAELIEKLAIWADTPREDGFRVIISIRNHQTGSEPNPVFRFLVVHKDGREGAFLFTTKAAELAVDAYSHITHVVDNSIKGFLQNDVAGHS